MQTWQSYALASAFFAALTAVLGKLGVAGIDSNLATFVRTLVILVLTAALITYQGKWNNTALSGSTLRYLVLSGIATGLSWLCYYRALQLGKASQVAPVDKLSVALAVLFSVLILGERLSLRSGLGVLLIVVGSLVMVW